MNKFLAALLIILTNCSVDATLYKLKILEKKLPSAKTQRVILWSDWHYSDKDVCTKQALDVAQMYNTQARDVDSIALYLEAPKPEHAQLVKDLNGLLRDLAVRSPAINAKLLHGISPIEEVLYDLFRRDTSYSDHGNIEERLLAQCAQALNKSPGVSYLDTRLIFGGLGDLLIKLYPYPVYKNSSLGSLVNRTLKQFSTLTLEEFFKLVTSMLDGALTGTKQLLKISKSRENREKLETLQENFSFLKELADQTAQLYAPYKKQQALPFFLKRINTVFNELKDDESWVTIQDFIEQVIGEELYHLMLYINDLSNQASRELLIWLFDSVVLANIVSSKSPVVSHVIAGDAHNTNTAEFLENEGFKVVYDSGLTLKTGGVVDNFRELDFKIMMDKASQTADDDIFVDYVTPTHEERKGYLLPITQEQMQTIFLSSAQLAKKQADSYKDEL